jgi:hypothetical protein
MNIKSRLKKLETVNGNGTICGCQPEYVETYLQDLGADTKTTELVRTTEPVPSICPKCFQPTEPKRIVIQLIDETSRDNFPLEWAKENKNTKT